MVNSIKIRKSTLYISIALLALILSSLLFYSIYLPKKSFNDDLNFYKKSLFDSTLCQYSCPLQEQEFQGRSQFFPLRPCVQKCLEDLAALNLDGTKFSDQDLGNDNLIKDLGDSISNCRNSSIINQDDPSVLENSKFFS